MCELLGLAFNRPVSPGLSFRGFRHRGRRNRDGWGLAAITATRPTVVKEPINAEESDTAATLPDRDPLHAPLFIGHVRAASRGRVSQVNTHPFSRVFAGGTFTFAHNGTLDVARLKKMSGPDFTPEGQTDSELAMGAVLTWLGSGQAAGGLADYPALEEFLRDLNALGEEKEPEQPATPYLASERQLSQLLNARRFCDSRQRITAIDKVVYICTLPCRCATPTQRTKTAAATPAMLRNTMQNAFIDICQELPNTSSIEHWSEPPRDGGPL